MFSWIADSMLLFTALPFFPFIILWFLSSYWIKEKKRRMKLAIDVTTVFLVASVAGLYNVIFSSEMGIYLLLLIYLLTAGLIGGFMYRKQGHVDVLKLLRAIWRISFLILSVVYILLIIIGIMTYFYKL
ncbi:DUF3397 domain-containing protein [Paenibacillus aquistagni]|uniref:DUF3397 domain-containing protein n=1 Tax=Paenibacillus aquistagni TaxID=1852522 RepID=UPI00145ACE22|nr:DUF3397 domain-containing protein [Paenibacillus aquistagni]NMM51472.1 DUF3397 domain-containing protein [Paenibacillus aquistagni]